MDEARTLRCSKMVVSGSILTVATGLRHPTSITQEALLVGQKCLETRTPRIYPPSGASLLGATRRLALLHLPWNGLLSSGRWTPAVPAFQYRFSNI